VEGQAEQGGLTEVVQNDISHSSSLFVSQNVLQSAAAAPVAALNIPYTMTHPHHHPHNHGSGSDSRYHQQQQQQPAVYSSMQPPPQAQQQAGRTAHQHHLLPPPFGYTAMRPGMTAPSNYAYPTLPPPQQQQQGGMVWSAASTVYPRPSSLAPLNHSQLYGSSAQENGPSNGMAVHMSVPYPQQQHPPLPGVLYHHPVPQSNYHSGYSGRAAYPSAQPLSVYPSPGQPPMASFIPSVVEDEAHQRKRRHRRRFEEVDRHYSCTFPGCSKSYGTLNHLNHHIVLQKHGPKRNPAEFRELRRYLRDKKAQEKLEQETRPAPIDTQSFRGSNSIVTSGGSETSSMHHAMHWASAPASAPVESSTTPVSVGFQFNRRASMPPTTESYEKLISPTMTRPPPTTLAEGTRRASMPSTTHS
jgi:hypothetical protein